MTFIRYLAKSLALTSHIYLQEDLTGKHDSTVVTFKQQVFQLNCYRLKSVSLKKEGKLHDTKLAADRSHNSDHFCNVNIPEQLISTSFYLVQIAL